MAVVAVIGVLAALAIYGVRNHLATTRTAEAKEKVGAITRGATSAYERESATNDAPTEGTNSSTTSHALCDSAVPVPAAVPAGRKYQPKTAVGEDFNTGDGASGWLCLKFSISQPHFYQYQYNRDSTAAAPGNPGACSSDCFEAGAVGDTDGDGVFARFARTGHINTSTKVLRTSTSIYVEEEHE